MKLKLAPCKRGGEAMLMEEESKRKKKCRVTAVNTNEITLGDEEKRIV